MANALDYIYWRGDLSFAQSPFNRIDYLICSQMAAPDYSGIIDAEGEGVTISEVEKKYFDSSDTAQRNLGVLQSSYVLPTLHALAGCVRYADVKMAHYVNRISNENEEQFSAVTFLLPDGTLCVSYRGTDDTFIGWKEDFHLATREHVPAQKDALDYLVEVASVFSGDIRVCGHSKGGNLAVYAGVMAPEELQGRIISICSFDGPGFRTEFLESEQYKAAEGKIQTVLSQNSLVGMLLHMAGTPVIVKTNISGPMAHDGFSWEVLGTEFIRCDELSDGSKAFRDAMASTLDAMNTEEKENFVNELFDSFMAGGAETITDFTDFNLSNAIEVAKSFRSGKEVNRFVLNVMEAMRKSYRQQIAEDITEKTAKIINHHISSI